MRLIIGNAKFQEIHQGIPDIELVAAICISAIASCQVKPFPSGLKYRPAGPNRPARHLHDDPIIRPIPGRIRQKSIIRGIIGTFIKQI